LRTSVVFVHVVFGVAVLTASVASKSSGAARLEGRWKGRRADGVTPELQSSANAFAVASEITVRGDQIAFTTPAARNVTATLFVDKDEGGAVVIHTNKDVSSETFTFSGDKTMSWKIDEKRSIVFEKVD